MDPGGETCKIIWNSWKFTTAGGGGRRRRSSAHLLPMYIFLNWMDDKQFLTAGYRFDCHIRLPSNPDVPEGPFSSQSEGNFRRAKRNR